MTEKTYPLAGPIRKTCDLFRLLAGHELLGLAPGEIAKGLGVPPSWVSQNLPALEAADRGLAGMDVKISGALTWGDLDKVARALGHVAHGEAVAGRLATTVATNLNADQERIAATRKRYSIPL